MIETLGRLPEILSIGGNDLTPCTGDLLGSLVSSEKQTGQNGDDGLFQIMVDSYYQDLYRFGMSLAKDPDTARDLVQHTYLIFAQKGGQIRDQSKAKSWLFTALYREFTSSYRKNQRLISLDSMDIEVATESADDTAARETERTEVLEALRNLEETHRAILSLYYLNQLSYKEIAAILELPIGTVMSRLSRAKELLRRKIGLDDGSPRIKPAPANSRLTK